MPIESIEIIREMNGEDRGRKVCKISFRNHKYKGGEYIETFSLYVDALADEVDDAFKSFIEEYFMKIYQSAYTQGKVRTQMQIKSALGL